MSRSDFTGDWYCPNQFCRMHVYSANMQCKKCGTARPFDYQLPAVESRVDSITGFRPGDWMCPNPSCRNHVFSANICCKNCGTKKPDESTQFNSGYSPPSVGLYSGGMSGDWTCPNPACKSFVFYFNASCRKCGTAKPGDIGFQGTTVANSSGVDCICLNPSCGSLVPDSHQFCGKCGSAKFTQSCAQAGLSSTSTVILHATHQNGCIGDSFYATASASNYFSATPLVETTRPSESMQGFGLQFHGGHGVGAGGGGYSDAIPVDRLSAVVGEVSEARFRPGDWWCPICSNHVVSFSHVCNLCHTSKPDGGGQLASTSRSYAGPVFTHDATAAASFSKTGFCPGDWICPNTLCQNNVYSFNDTCEKCGSRRPESSSDDGGVGDGDQYSAKRQYPGRSGVVSVDGSDGTFAYPAWPDNHGAKKQKTWY